MQRLNLPDGRFVEVPDDITRDQAIDLQNLLAAEYPDFYTPYQPDPETTLSGDALEIIKGIPRGLGSTFLSAGEGIVNLFDSGNDSDLGDYLRDLQQSLNESSIGAAEGYEDRFSSKLGQGLGSFASFLVPGTLVAKTAGLAGKAAKVSDNLAKAGRSTADINKAVRKIYRPQTYSTLGLALPVGIAEQGRNIREAERLGEDVSGGQELFAEILGAGIGASEIFAPQRLLRSIDKATAARLRVPQRLIEAVQTGGVEGLQEMTAGILQDVVARGVYSDKLPIGDSALDDATVGGATGFIADLFLRGIAGRKSLGSQYEFEKETEARQQEEEARNKKKKLFDSVVNDTDIESIQILTEEQAQPLVGPVNDNIVPEVNETKTNLIEDELDKLPVLEDLIVETQQIANPTTREFDTIFNLVGSETGQIFGQFNNNETALQAKQKIAAGLSADFIDSLADQTADITGFKNNGTIKALGRKLYNPNYNNISAKTIAMFDSRTSESRKAQVAQQKEIDEVKAQLEKELQAVQLAGAGSVSPQTLKKLERLEKKLQTLSVVDYKQGKQRLVKQKRKDLAPLDQVYERADKLGLDQKSEYTIKEAKKLLKPEDFNALMSEKANIIYKIDEKTGVIKSIQQDADKIDVSRKALQDTLRNKRIKTRINSPEFEYLAETLVGEKNFNKMNRGQKELLITRLKGLPIMSDLATGSFDALQRLPNMKPREYTAQDVRAFYRGIKNEPSARAVTDKEIDAFFNLRDKQLNKKQRDQFKKDLVESGRAIKVGNRVRLNPDFEKIQAQRSTPFFETEAEYLNRLNKSGLPQETIKEKVAVQLLENKNRLAIPEVDPKTSEPQISEEAREELYTRINERLKGYGIANDVRVRIVNGIRTSRKLGLTSSGQPYFKAKTKDEETAEMEFDQNLNDIFVFSEKISKDIDGTTEQREQVIDNVLANIDHETIHALIKLDLITEAEYQNLLEFAITKLGSMKVTVNGETISELQRINRAYANLRNQDALNEEYIAEMFRLYRDNPKDFQSKPKTTIEKILNFFANFVEAITGSVFRSPLRVLEDIRTGTIGARTRNIQRSLRTSRRIFGQALTVAEGDQADEPPDARDQFDESVFDQPAQIRRGLAARDLLGESDLENDVLAAFRRTNGRITAKDFQDIFKRYSPRGAVPPFKDLKELQKDVQDALRIGVDANWYQRWSLQVPNIVGAVNVNEFSGVFGITSEQTTPEKNFQDALNTMITAREINPETNRKKFIAKLSELNVGKRNKDRLNRIADLYKDGMFFKKGSGQKTLLYAQTIEQGASNRFVPFGVIDVHMLRKLGLIPAGKKLTAAPDISYQIGNAMLKALSSLDYVVNGQVTQIPDVSKIQALLWGHQRYTGSTKIHNQGSYEAAAAQSKTQIAKIKEMKRTGKWNTKASFNNKFLYGARYVNNNNTFDTDTKHNFTNAILGAGTKVVNEFMPGRDRGYIPTTLTIPQDIRNKFYFKTLNALSTGNQLNFLAELGIPHQVTLSAGSWQGEWNPNILLSLPMTGMPTQRAIAKLIMDATLQDSNLIIKPSAQGIAKSGIYLEKANGADFSEQELTEVLNTVDANVSLTGGTNFTVMPHKNVNGLTFIHPKSFNNEMTAEDLEQMFKFFKDYFPASGYTVSTYGQEQEYYEYNAGEARGALQEIQSQDTALEPSDIQRAAIRTLYLPFQRVYEDFAKEVGFTARTDKAYELPDSAIQPLNGAVDKAEIDAIVEIDRQVRNTRPTARPRFNNNASGFAKKVAVDFEKGNLDYLDIPTFKRSDTTVPPGYEKLFEDMKATIQEPKTFWESISENVEWTESASRFLTRQRAKYIFGYAAIEKNISKGAKTSANIAEEEARARTGALQALLLSDKSKGIFGAMLNHGVPTLDKGIVSVTKDKRLSLINIFGPLINEMRETGVDLENTFKVYAIATRGVRLDEKGFEIPMTPEQIEEGLELGNRYPIVKETFELYQEQNAYIIDLLVDSGLASREPNYTEIRERLLELGIDRAKTADNETLIELATERNEVLKTADKIELRPTAEVWKDNADYYPFYRVMADESIQGPNIGAGSLGGNPLNQKLKGSKEALEASPLSVIFKNQLAIVNAAMKNDAHRKLVRNYVKSDRAEEISSKEAQGSDVIPIYVNGVKRFFRVEDPEMLYGLTTAGILNENAIVKFLSFPATVLRETVTRDPGFIAVNMLRDTLSAFVTSGANFTPVIGTVKGFAEDMENLERFGILGGYDYSADALSVEKYVKQQFRLAGKDGRGAMNPTTMALKLWDFLGKQTYKSDGATRQAVYKAVYEQTGDEVEAAFQAGEIINFSRRGNDPLARVVFSAIPFLNARVQGLDVLYRSMTGKYSAKYPGASVTSNKQMQNQIIAGFITRGGFLTFLTAIYYALVSDDDQYKERRREERDDHWMIFREKGQEPLKLPVPFEVGLLFKTIPERIMDTVVGSSTTADLTSTLKRGATNTLALDPLGFQAIKPFMEAFIDNKSGFTGSPIVPQYMESGLEPFQQSRETTNELARLIGRTFNISPIKLEYVMNGYGGTLGGYVLSLIDATLRQITGEDYITPRIDQLPLLKRFLASPIGGGLQQQFYELRAESDKVVATINSLRENPKLEDALITYIRNNDGLIRTRQQVLALDRYMTYWRDRRDRTLRDDTLSAEVKKDLLQELELERNLRLMYLPELREEAYATQ